MPVCQFPTEIFPSLTWKIFKPSAYHANDFWIPDREFFVRHSVILSFGHTFQSEIGNKFNWGTFIHRSLNKWVLQSKYVTKRKIFSLNDKTLEMSSDPNPISHGAHLTLF